MQIVQVLSSYRDDSRKHPEVEKELVSKLRSHWSNSAFFLKKNIFGLKSIGSWKQARDTSDFSVFQVAIFYVPSAPLEKQSKAEDVVATNWTKQRLRWWVPWWLKCSFRWCLANRKQLLVFVLAKTELHNYTGTGEDKVPRSRAATPLLLRRFGIVEAGCAQKAGCHQTLRSTQWCHLNLKWGTRKVRTLMLDKDREYRAQREMAESGSGWNWFNILTVASTLPVIHPWLSKYLEGTAEPHSTCHPSCIYWCFGML